MIDLDSSFVLDFVLRGGPCCIPCQFVLVEGGRVSIDVFSNRIGGLRGRRSGKLVDLSG